MINLFKIALIGTALSFSYGAQAQMSSQLEAAMESCESATGDAIPSSCYNLINLAESELATSTVPNTKFLAHLAMVQPKNRFENITFLRAILQKLAAPLRPSICPSMI